MEPDSGFLAIDDEFTAVEDTSDNPLDVLDNDISQLDAPLTISEVGVPNRGGRVEIVDGTLLSYTPAADFFGPESFDYTITDGRGLESRATVEVLVADVNDPPTARDDQRTVSQDSVDNVVNVRNNDSIDPDFGEVLRITQVGLPSAGGIADSPDGTNIVYTPRSGFLGEESFTYMISDGRGGTDSAIVTVEVVERPDLVNFRLDVTSEEGSPIDEVREGDRFVLRGFVEDLRVQPEGVFAAFLDVSYDANLATAIEDIVIHDPFVTDQSGDRLEGLLDEVGGTQFITPVDGGEKLLFSVVMLADAPGMLEFNANRDNMLSPLHDVVLNNTEQPVRNEDIQFQSITIDVAGTGRSE